MESAAHVGRSIPGPRAGHVAVRAGNCVLIWGGYDEPVSRICKSFWGLVSFGSRVVIMIMDCNPGSLTFFSIPNPGIGKAQIPGFRD